MPQTHTSFFARVNAKAVLLAFASLAMLGAALPSTNVLAENLKWSRACLYAFLGMLVFLLQCRLVRRKDKEFVKSWWLSFSVGVLATALMLLIARGDAGNLTAVAVIAMFCLSSSSVWTYEKSPRPNIVRYFLSCIPTALVSTIISLIPGYAVTLPGIALASSPVAYAAWCGLVFPFLSAMLRILAITYFSNYALGLVRDKKMTPEGVVPFLSTVSFNIGACLLFGNSMLLYLSKDVKYAASSAAFAILTEVAGKLYTAVLITNQGKVANKIRKKARRISKEQRTSRVAAVVTEGDEEGAFIAEEDDGAEDRKQVDELLVMFAVRLSNEIVAEKVCIIVAAFVNAFVIDTAHSGATIAAFAVVFIFTELVSDELLVFALVNYFDVPLLRLPVEKFEWRSVEFWSGILEVALVPVFCTFFFLHAYMSASRWLAKGDGAS